MHVTNVSGIEHNITVHDPSGKTLKSQDIPAHESITDGDRPAQFWGLSFLLRQDVSHYLRHEGEDRGDLILPYRPSVPPEDCQGAQAVPALMMCPSFLCWFYSFLRIFRAQRVPQQRGKSDFTALIACVEDRTTAVLCQFPEEMWREKRKAHEKGAYLSLRCCDLLCVPEGYD